MTQLLMIVLLFVGLALRILVRTYQADKETGEALNPLDVCWEGPEKWRTITQAVLIVAAGALLPPEFFKVLAGLEVQGVSLGWFIMIAAGFNIELLSQKLLARARERKE